MTITTTSRPIQSSADLRELSRLEWQAAVELGYPHDLSEDDREYQRRCFERAESYRAEAEKLQQQGK